MSLINEALKKAQRQRTDDPGGVQPPIPGAGGRIAKRTQPRSATAMVLITTGAITLVVLSVVITVLLVNDSPSVPVAVAPAASSSNPAAPAPAPTIVAKGESPAPETGTLDAATLPPAAVISLVDSAAGADSAAAQAPRAGILDPAEAAASAAPSDAKAPGEKPAVATSAPAGPPPPPKPDERIHAFLDTLRVTGIRSSGDESRVLMNDRVHRVNDIVERTLGVRLIKVDVDSLTFSDPHGHTYVKYF